MSWTADVSGNGVGAALLLAPLLYARAMLRFRRAWQQLSPPRHPPPGPAQPVVSAGPVLSVLIAARNEARNLPALLRDLQLQTLSADYFEVLVVDDHSTDTTAAVVRDWAARVSYPLRLLSLAARPGARPGKKAAIEMALAGAHAPWVVCTDADCRVGPAWLQKHAALAADPAVQFVSGPVLLTGQGWLAELQGVELAGLVGVGAAGIGRGRPTMCNGANLGYRKAAFAAVRGFAGNEHVPSGDDEFLLHKIHAAYPAGVRFLREEGAIVRTAAQPTLRALLRQRVRWASKWQHYQHNAPRRLAVLVLLANVALLAGLVLAFFYPALSLWVAGAWLLKLGSDVWFLSPVLGFFSRRRWLWWLPLLQLAYAPYALATGLLGLRGGYIWKGRKVGR
ncbi:glycosyltransferase [Hymenobacter fastidiosus]|uniref:Glycosyltransferase n=1 Tax=Hymenobacter fastidiosus TaxID=486264 RepID=A0ABP7RDE0_9BACT